MSIDWLAKFEQMGIHEADCPLLFRDIENANDLNAVGVLIYIFGYSCDKDQRILPICDRHIRSPVPGLTAICMRVAIEYWGLLEKYMDVLAKYLDMDLFEEWYDEVIFAAGYVSRLDPTKITPQLADRFQRFTSDPRAKREGLLEPL